VKARIEGVDYYLPTQQLTNADLAAEFPEWSVEKISSKTGIRTRHIAADDEFTSDLAVAAGRKLLDRLALSSSDIDYLIVCTQSPDYFLPSVSTIVQDRLGLSTAAGAADVNLGCSGYIYSLGIAKGLIESDQVSNALVITSDTYSKFVNPKDKSVRTIFGDGAAATLVSATAEQSQVYAITYGSDGTGASSLLVPNGGLRDGRRLAPKAATDARKLTSNGFDLYMDGPAIFNFTIDAVPRLVDTVLEKAQLQLEDVDLFVLHQANKFMLEHLRTKLGIDRDRFFVSMEDSGNTVSSTIPIALTEAERAGKLLAGHKVMLLGFGVGLSWGGLMVQW
jgi:3-oxoacyl-[acyl-carrier-protein] synthase-3